jgi:hypothetical protein
MMKMLVLVAALGVGACAWMGQGRPQMATQSGPYDNTADSLGGRFTGGIAGGRN